MKELLPPDDMYGLSKIMAILAWILLLVAFGLFFHYWRGEAKAPIVVSADGNQETIIKRSDDNQYLTQGEINGIKVTFLLDTGATDIVIPGNLEKKLKLTRGYESHANTAGGNIVIYATRIQELKIGHIVLRNLPAHIAPKMDGEILLGMTALKRIHFQQSEDAIVLTTRPAPER